MHKQSESINDHLNISHVIPFLGVAQGGPVHALAQQLKHQAANHNITIHSSPTIDDGERATFPESVKTHAHLSHSTLGLRFCPNLGRQLGQQADSIDILHSHLMWTDCHRHAARVSRKYQIPHIISPCGTLNGDAISFRSYKKRPIAWIYQNKALREAHCIHVKSEQELQSVRDYGIQTPVAVIPNMIETPTRYESIELQSHRRKYKLSANKRRLLYLGRIHPVKGLSRLIEAWRQLPAHHEEWELVIAGPDENNYQRLLESEIHAHNLENQIRFIGMLEQADKWRALQEADLFILPSDFENFGNSAAEAAISGTPIIATDATPWEALRQYKAGWWVETNPTGLKNALEEAFSLPRETLQMMGKNAKKLVINYSPKSVCQQWQGLYQWILAPQETPDFIHIS